jgi:hypothetical protein
MIYTLSNVLEFHFSVVAYCLDFSKKGLKNSKIVPYYVIQTSFEVLMNWDYTKFLLSIGAIYLKVQYHPRLVDSIYTIYLSKEFEILLAASRPS